MNKKKQRKNFNQKVAVVCDPLFKYGGAELHLKYILEAFPNSELFTAFYDEGFVKEYFPNVKIHHSFMQYIPGKFKFRELLLLLQPLAYRSFNFKNYDIVLSHTISFAKFAKPPKGIKHICSCMSPPKFLWDRSARSIRNENDFKGINKFLFKFYSFFMDTFLEDLWKKWDKNAANRCDKILGNSNTVRERIKKYYDIDADVIYPPVEVKKIKEHKLMNRRENWFVYVGRVESYKGVELAIRACVKAGVQLKVVGKGNDLERMKELVRELKARGSIKFLGFVSDEEKFDLFSRCKAFVYPVRKEDFGIVAVEANAAGAPVIAFREGGVLETISENNPKTGKFFDKYTVDELASILKNFKSENYNPSNCRKQADNFAAEIFVYKIQNYVQDTLQEN